MALQDIINAIIAQADQQIADTRAVHQKELTTLREQHERELRTKRHEISLQKDKRRDQLRAKAENHAETLRRNAELTKKQELLQTTYDTVLEKLAHLSDADLEPLFGWCLKGITSKGTIHPAKKHVDLIKKVASSDQFTIGEPIDAKGGFRFVSDKREEDCTLEHLVAEVLRPQTELEISTMLFSA